MSKRDPSSVGAPAAPRGNEQFQSLELIVYPKHGLCVVEDIEEFTFGDFSEHAYKLRAFQNTGAIIQVPVSNADRLGLRPPSSEEKLRSVLGVLKEPKPPGPVLKYHHLADSFAEKTDNDDLHGLAHLLKSLLAPHHASAKKSAPGDLRAIRNKKGEGVIASSHRNIAEQCIRGASKNSIKYRYLKQGCRRIRLRLSFS